MPRRGAEAMTAAAFVVVVCAVIVWALAVLGVWR
jgi:hypothetical protein